MTHLLTIIILFIIYPNILGQWRGEKIKITPFSCIFWGILNLLYEISPLILLGYQLIIKLKEMVHCIEVR